MGNTSLAVPIVLLVLTGCHLVRAPSPRGGRAGETAAQALVGLGRFHKLEVRRQDPFDPSNSVEADLTLLPGLGIAGQYALGGRDLEFGLDGGLLYSENRDRSRVPSAGPGGVLELDVRLRTLEGFLGPYVSGIVDDRFRLYAAAGVSLMYGDAEYDDLVVLEDDSAFGVGGHVRAGVEYRLRDRRFLGLGVRWVATELDFDRRLGELDVEGWQAMLTYTVGF